MGAKDGEELVVKKPKMLFSHTFSVYRCIKCGHTHENVSPNFSKFDLISVGVGFVPTYALAMWGKWQLPWYYFISVLAGEMLLVFLAGILVTPALLMTSKSTVRCPKCRGTLLSSGNYFKLSAKPHWSDFVLLAIFIGLNLFVWFKLIVNPA